jgi:hypothetical protein
MPIDLPTFAASVLTAGGGSAALSLLIARAFGSKWLEHRFNARLEALKHDHNTEVEHLRFRIARLLDRSTKLNQREFEVLPNVWAKIGEAHHRFLSLIAIWQQSADLSHMGSAQLESFIQGCSLQDWQKDELRAETNPYKRTTYYSNAMSWHELHKTVVATATMNNAVSESSIYIHPDAYDRIKIFVDRLNKAVTEWQLDQQMRAGGDGALIDTSDDSPVQSYRKTGDTDFQALETFLRDRYWGQPANPV